MSSNSSAWIKLFTTAKCLRQSSLLSYWYQRHCRPTWPLIRSAHTWVSMDVAAVTTCWRPNVRDSAHARAKPWIVRIGDCRRCRGRFHMIPTECKCKFSIFHVKLLTLYFGMFIFSLLERRTKLNVHFTTLHSFLISFHHSIKCNVWLKSFDHDSRFKV